MNPDFYNEKTSPFEKQKIIQRILSLNANTAKEKDNANTEDEESDVNVLEVDDISYEHPGKLL